MSYNRALIFVRKASVSKNDMLPYYISAVSPITEAAIDLAKKCDPANCVLPYCFCSKDGTVIPGGLEPEKVK